MSLSENHRALRLQTESIIQASLGQTSISSISEGETMIARLLLLTNHETSRFVDPHESCIHKLALAHILVLLRPLRLEQALRHSSTTTTELMQKQKQLMQMDLAGYVPGRELSSRQRLEDEIANLEIAVAIFYRDLNTLDTEFHRLQSEMEVLRSIVSDVPSANDGWQL